MHRFNNVQCTHVFINTPKFGAQLATKYLIGNSSLHLYAKCQRPDIWMGWGFAYKIFLARQRTHINMHYRPICINFANILIDTIKGAWSFLFSFFSKLLRFWYQKNRHIFLIIILKFHALIPLRLEENCKNSPILLIWVVTTNILRV